MKRFPALLLLSALASLNTAHANEGVRWDEGIGFYVGIDGRTQTAGGTYDGLPNPNAGRLTLLLDHGDHFHGIGTYSYTGSAAAPSITPTSANNRIPEPYSRIAPYNLPTSVSLVHGSGAWSGKWVSAVLPDEAPHHDYSHLGMASIQTLAGAAAGSPQATLFGSSGGRWNAPLDNVVVGLKLEYITPGLKVGSALDDDLFDQSDVFSLGAGNAFELTPLFWTAGDALPGEYTARFSLVNLGSNTAVQPSGTFYFDFSVPVPEPETWALWLAGLGMLGTLSRRRR